MKILTISDRVDERLHSPALRSYQGELDLVLSCGDLPYYYLEYIVTILGVPLFYVIGNHANEIKGYGTAPQQWEYPGGCENVDGRTAHYKGLLIAGLEGSMRYNDRPHFQYTEAEMARKVWQLTPWLVLNRLRHGRYLDILITHAPPYGIHDASDPCHTGFQAFLGLMRRFRPRYLIHGHVHTYGPATTETVYQATRVINTYNQRILEIPEATSRPC